MKSGKKSRLDNLLVARGIYATRSRARDAISRGCVKVNNCVEQKPGAQVHSCVEVDCDDPAKSYVSRAALKLKHGLSISQTNVNNKICLDIGASTGGFSQVMLDAGAAHVFALDVGHGQLDPKIKNLPSLTELSGLNARDLTPDHLNFQKPEILVSDVSFISLKLALPPALNIAKSNARGVFLIKPQFEVGREHIGKGGIVCDVETGERAALALCDWLNEFDRWQVTHFAPSPVIGSDGNSEYLVAAEKTK